MSNKCNNYEPECDNVYVCPCLLYEDDLPKNMHLQILSDGSVSLNGIRITKNKTNGIVTVVSEYIVDTETIKKILDGYL